MFYKIFKLIFFITVQLLSRTIIINAYEPRIIGGSVATENQFPYQVYLTLNDQFLCGGVIYNKFYVITAAHCVVGDNGNKYDTSSVKIFAGNNKRSETSTGNSFDVENIIVHEKYRYNGRSPLYDIALIKLKNELEFSDSIKPIELYTGRDIRANQKIIVSGWGRTSSNSNELSNELKYAEMRTMTQRQCFFAIRVYSRNILCLSHSSTTNICNGDSGGPATYNGKLVGIASFGVGRQCSGRAPVGYTKTLYFNNWITQNTQ